MSELCGCPCQVLRLFDKVKNYDVDVDLKDKTIFEICRVVNKFKNNPDKKREFLENILIDRKGARSVIGGNAFHEVRDKIGYTHTNPRLEKYYEKNIYSHK